MTILTAIVKWYVILFWAGWTLYATLFWLMIQFEWATIFG